MSFDLQALIDSGQGVIMIPEGDHHLGQINVHRPCIIMGHSRLTCRIYGSFNVAPGIDPMFSHFRLTGSGEAQSGFVIHDWFFGRIDGLLIEDFEIGVNVLAGTGWMVMHTYFANCKYDIRIQNNIEPDRGDMLLFGNTHDSKNGVTCVHQLSSGGLRMLGNKYLGHDYGYLGEIAGNTSDLLALGNSTENQRVCGFALRKNGGDFSNVVHVGNQFALNAPAISVEGIARFANVGNAINCPGHQALNAPDCADSVSSENACTQGTPAPAPPPSPEPTSIWKILFPWLQ